VAKIGTHAGILVMPEDERRATLDRVAAYLATHDATAHGVFELPVLTAVLRGDVRVFTSADVATEVTAPALVEVLYELGKIATLPAKEEELDATVQYLTGTLALGTATQSGLAELLADILSDGMGVDWLQEYPARLAAATLEDVQEAAAAMLAPEKLVKVVVGDADRVEAGLATLTEVTRG
jgi:hypothetical protein